MTVDLWEIDAVACSLYQRAGLDPATPERPIRVAKAILGRDGVRVMARGVPGDAKLAMVKGRWFIFIRSKLPVQRRAFAIAHELAEWAARTEHDPTIELACNAIAAAVIAPRESFMRTLRAHGEDLPALAAAYETTETLAALRLGEVTDRPLVALTPTHLWVRGREWCWPDETELRRIARTGHPGIRKVAITDARRRVVLIGDEGGEVA